MEQNVLVVESSSGQQLLAAFQTWLTLSCSCTTARSCQAAALQHIAISLPKIQIQVSTLLFLLLQVRGLFSATLPEGVEELASSVLQSPLRLVVGPRNAPTSAVSQHLMFVGREGGKILGLRQLIAKGLTPPVLLFVSSKERAEAVHR